VFPRQGGGAGRKKKAIVLIRKKNRGIGKGKGFFLYAVKVSGKKGLKGEKRG